MALPLYHPSEAPYSSLDRGVFAFRDTILLGLAIAFVVKVMRRTDELERSIQLGAMAWSYGIALVALVSYGMADDILPPLRGVWVASLMLGCFVVAWLASSIGYER